MSTFGWNKVREKLGLFSCWGEPLEIIAKLTEQSIDKFMIPRKAEKKWMRSSRRNVFRENFFNSPELPERGERNMKWNLLIKRNSERKNACCFKYLTFFSCRQVSNDLRTTIVTIAVKFHYRMALRWCARSQGRWRAETDKVLSN